MSMRFERDIKPYSEPVISSQLKEGDVYFALTFLEEEMLTPVLETLVFIGRNLEPGDKDQVYFQDVESFNNGSRYSDPPGDGRAKFSAASERHISHIFDYEHVLDQMIACALRRAKSRTR